MKNIIIGTLAHVDAGKTTLSESLLYTCGSIRKIGRVDHKDTFLDFNEQERGRGITIFSKEANFTYNDTNFTLVDTPGHVDFSCEMERALQVIDYAIVLISGLDGVQPHSETIWKLLEHYNIPAFVFVNKMDISHKSKDELMLDIKKSLSSNCVCFNDENFEEEASMASEETMNYFLENLCLETSMIQDAITSRKIFPVYFGSALKQQGLDAFIDGMHKYTKAKTYPEQFGALVYKITHDENGNKLTHMKIMGGTLKAKQKINEYEKVDQIRLYSGNKFNVVNEIEAGRVCAIKGLKNVLAGEGLGIAKTSDTPILAPFMNYHMVLPKHMDPIVMMKHLEQLALEDPQMHFYFDEDTNEIRVELMGEIQIDVLKTQIKNRFDVDVDFDHGKIRYKESILEAVEGVGHFEPLRHYAEVHVLLEPLPLGSGLKFASVCPQDQLSQNWQRLIVSHMEEKEHKGVLSGSPITDMKITLLSGKAHLKHTEGGDFRQATYRAIRNGLKKAQSILLEPYYQFRLEVSNDCLSKAIFDIESMDGTFSMQTSDNDTTILTGMAPVSKMQNYQKEVYIYTKGKGKFFATLKEYQPCKYQDKVLENIYYDSEKDFRNPTGSVFCEHGAGFYVPWDEVESYMHLPYAYSKKDTPLRSSYLNNKYSVDDEEVKKIFNAICGGEKRKKYVEKPKKVEGIKEKGKVVKVLPNCMLVDGYNIVHAWDELKEIAKDNIDSARARLIDILASYQGYRDILMIVVFDAYKRDEHQETIEKNGDFHVVYTKTAQTADSYIENTAHKLAKDYNITVATSDGLEQLIVSGQGAIRMSARELYTEVRHTIKKYEEEQFLNNMKRRNTPLMEIRSLLNEEEQE